ncbi:hypothetical protein ACKKBF_B39145 [Auxenochlorella protothecoides x Auxenochlorella symbiontica]
MESWGALDSVTTNVDAPEARPMTVQLAKAASTVGSWPWALRWVAARRHHALQPLWEAPSGGHGGLDPGRLRRFQPLLQDLGLRQLRFKCLLSLPTTLAEADNVLAGTTHLPAVQRLRAACGGAAFLPAAPAAARLLVAGLASIEAQRAQHGMAALRRVDLVAGSLWPCLVFAGALDLATALAAAAGAPALPAAALWRSARVAVVCGPEPRLVRSAELLRAAAALDASAGSPGASCAWPAEEVLDGRSCGRAAH